MRSNDLWKKISEIIDVRDGTHDSPKYVSEGYPLITSKNIKDNKIDFGNASLISKADLEKINQRSKVDIGDIIMPMIGTIGNPVIVNTDILFAIKNVALFKFHKCNVDNRYIYYLLKSPIVLNQLHTLKRGGTQEFVSLANIRNLKIPLPPLETQKKIAAVLDKAQELIEKRKEQHAKLDEFVQSVFLEMFGDPVSNVKEWSTYKGHDYSDLITVGVVVKPASYYADKGVIALRSLNIKPNHIDLSNLVYFTSEASNGVLSKSVLQLEDVVIVRTGLTGTAAVIPQELEGVNCIDLIIVRPKKTMINSHYLSYMLNSERGKNLVASKEVGGIQKHFNIGAIKDIAFPIPPLDLQNQFAAIVEKTEQQKALMQQSFAEMENNMNSLMQRAFKGELW
jgi:Restriction endonuclease S subunits